MSRNNLVQGLYLVRQPAPEKGVDHYGVLDVGNRMRLPNVTYRTPVVIHQTPPSIRVDWFAVTGIWQVLGMIADEAAAILRINAALANPAYDLFGHNCEHFARYVATGKRESVQLQTIGVVAAIGLLVVVAAKSN